ncbi:DoxX family protein [Stagnihabitans tardus]|uniref:DoxX family membrane protein n=1 Tax=Stagnihabitans tardus TaxID=2699202 RepID=A0AAE4YBF4_9RHOB|nr:DoxX family protein [Stagnihabitans tardus]NBZ88592.1 DoxX family membrane protein [Stagnihabitans tardus]
MTTVTSDFATDRSTDLAAALLRVTNGALFVFHGLMKVFIFTIPGTVGYFESIGLPGFLAYLTILAEVGGGLALLAGFKVKPVSLILALVLVGAGYFGHGANGFVFSNANGGWEYPAFWAIVMVVQALLGAGAYAVARK